jgi:hypothetical protein
MPSFLGSAKAVPCSLPERRPRGKRIAAGRTRWLAAPYYRVAQPQPLPRSSVLLPAGPRTGIRAGAFTMFLAEALPIHLRARGIRTAHAPRPEPGPESGKARPYPLSLQAVRDLDEAPGEEASPYLSPAQRLPGLLPAGLPSKARLPGRSAAPGCSAACAGVIGLGARMRRSVPLLPLRSPSLFVKVPDSQPSFSSMVRFLVFSLSA